jgi:hypothetical protein
MLSDEDEDNPAAPAGSGPVYAPPMAFRATRDYMHSTDLYPAILEGASALGLGVVDGPVHLAIRRLISRQPVFHYGDPAVPRDAGTAAGDFSLGIGDRVIEGVILQGAIPVAARKAYDETSIWREARIDGHRLSLSAAPSGATPIEIVTALAVLLHNRSLPPPAGEKWLLATLDLVRPLAAADGERIELEIERRLGAAVTRTRIRCTDAPVGAMAFVRRRLG